MDKKAHEAVEGAIARLDKVSVEQAAWMIQFNAMQTKLLKHVADEESNIFPKIRGVLSVVELNELGDMLKIAKEQRQPAAAAV